MGKHDSDNLKALFERFLGVNDAEGAAEDIRQAEQILDAYPAPSPSPQALRHIRGQIAAELSRKHKLSRIYRYVGVAAAVIVVGIVGFFGHAPQRADTVSHAGLLPTAIWESDDIASDDAELAYLTSEISRIEGQIEALRSGEEDNAGTGTLAELEVELHLLETQFWKE